MSSPASSDLDRYRSASPQPWSESPDRAPNRRRRNGRDLNGSTAPLDWVLDTDAFNALCKARREQRIEAAQEARLRSRGPTADDARIFAATEYNDDRQHHGASRAWRLGQGPVGYSGNAAPEQKPSPRSKLYPWREARS